jgi:ubiquinone/menaquinone biosynthesis C-methylase UbiE
MVVVVIIMSKDYVHGYSKEEANRLVDQANTLDNILHEGTKYSAGSNVLEAGCGVGAQTIRLAKSSPDAEITSIDISEDSIMQAKELVEQNGFSNIEFQRADLLNLPFEDETFDHIFVCFVLEHLQILYETFATKSALKTYDTGIS